MTWCGEATSTRLSKEVVGYLTECFLQWIASRVERVCVRGNDVVRIRPNAVVGACLKLPISGFALFHGELMLYTRSKSFDTAID